MTQFTDSPYEHLMKQKPYAGKERISEPSRPPGSGCSGCPYGSRQLCIGTCMKKVLSPVKKQREEEQTTDSMKGGSCTWQC